MPNTMTYSSEMFANYHLASIMPPDASFQAIQNINGLSILLSVGSDQMLYAVVESPGTATGWIRYNLSAALGSAARPVKVKRVAIAQSQSSGLIDVIMAVAGAPDDLVYAMLGKSPTDLSWLGAPSWTLFPYDAKHRGPASRVITGLFIRQAADRQYIVADLLREPRAAKQLVFRYFLDPSRTVTPGQVWNECDVAADLDSARIRTCLGRRAGDAVDGFYSSGAAAAGNVVLYQPLYNVFDPKVAANPTRLNLPTGGEATALDVTGPADASDLYVASGSRIYLFASTGQSDQVQGKQILSDPALQDVTELNVYTSGDMVTLLALTRADQVVRAQAPKARAADPAAWSAPLAIFTGVSSMATYLNRGDSADTLFLRAGSDRLIRARQTAESGTWRKESILLPPPSDAPVHKRNSFTTRVQVLDEHDRPAHGAQVRLSALRTAGFYINDLYYVLTPTPIDVGTDPMGALNIIEWSEGLAATPLRIDGFGPSVAINPMEKPFGRVRALDTADKIAAATITNKDGSTRALVKPGTPSVDLQAVAAAVGAMATAYDTLPADGSTAVANRPAAMARGDSGFRTARYEVIATVYVGGHPIIAQTAASAFGFGDWIMVTAGDLLEKLRSAGQYIVSIVKDTASDVWHFVATIGGRMFAFVFDAIEKVVASVEAVFRAIVSAIEDLIDYLRFLFGWHDILRTRDVIKQTFRLAALVTFDQLDTIKSQANDALNDAKVKVSDWAGIKASGWTSSLPSSDRTLSFGLNGLDIGKVLTSPGLFLLHHLMDHLADSSGGSGNAPVSDDPLGTAFARIMDPQGSLLVLTGRIRAQLLDGSAYASLSLSDLLEKVIAIAVDGMLNLAQSTLDILLDVLIALGRNSLELLDLPVRIPVVSDIIEDLFGVSTAFSMLDALALVAAVPATIGYKLLVGAAPFPSDSIFHSKLMQAKTPADLRLSFTPPRIARMGQTDTLTPTPSWSPIQIDADSQFTITVIGNMTAWLGGSLSAVLIAASLMSNDSIGEQMEKAAAISGAFTAAIAGIGTLFVDRAYPVQNSDVAKLSFSANVLTVSGKVASFAVQRSKWKGPQTKIAAAGFDALIALLGMSATCYHFHELAQAPEGWRRSEAIMDQTASLATQLSRCACFGARVVNDPESKLALIAITSGLTGLTGMLRVGVAMVASQHLPSTA